MLASTSPPGAARPSGRAICLDGVRVADLDAVIAEAATLPDEHSGSSRSPLHVAVGGDPARIGRVADLLRRHGLRVEHSEFWARVPDPVRQPAASVVETRALLLAVPATS